MYHEEKKEVCNMYCTVIAKGDRFKIYRVEPDPTPFRLIEDPNCIFYLSECLLSGLSFPTEKSAIKAVNHTVGITYVSDFMLNNYVF